MTQTHLTENQWKVYINGTYSPTYAPVTVSRVIGGKAVQSATIVQGATEAAGRQRSASVHEDLDCRTHFSNAATDPKLIVITRKDAAGTEVVVHVGRLVAVKLTLSQRGEETVYVSRFDHHLLADGGMPISFSSWADHQVKATDGSDEWTYGVDVDLDLVLNPIIDGVPRQNCVIETYTEEEEELTRAWPFDVDGVPTKWIVDASAPADVKWWTLADAVHYLLRTYNSNQTHVANPTRTALVTQLGADTWAIRNFKVPRGDHIPRVLDRLLDPLGYSWMYLYTTPTEKPTLHFWKRNTPPPAGTARSVPLQRFGQTVEISHLAPIRSECESYTIGYDAYSRSCEAVKAQGGLKEYEFTAELVPAWDPNSDSTALTSLIEDSPEMIADPTLKRVYRDWVLNEGGDYCEFAEHSDRKTGPYEAGLANAYAFAAVIGSSRLKRRRKLRKTLSITDDTHCATAGAHNGIRVEIWSPTEADWLSPQQLQLGKVEILDDEIGVRIGDPSKPPNLVADMFTPLAASAAGTIRVRVTGTVQADTRVSYQTAPTTNTLAKHKSLLLDLGSKYAFRDVHSSSTYSASAAHDTREYDSTADVKDIADHVLATWNASTVSGQIVLVSTQVVGDYLGWEIAGLQPRNLVVAATHASIVNPINPTVVSVSYDIQANKTTLTLDAIRQDLRAY